MSWIKLPAVEGSVSCLTCGAGARTDLDMDRRIAVGFGGAGYSKDGTVLYDENSSRVHDYEDAPTVGEVEQLALADPDHDWRIWFFAPLYEAEYQRHDVGIWVLVKKGQGFA